MKSAKILGYENYEIFEDGRVLNLNTGSYLLGSRNPAGYFLYRLTSSAGVAKTFGRHYLLAEAFIPKPYSEKILIVNHKDGIKGNDWLENLEWCTYQQNLEHAGAMGLSKKCIPILARNATTLEVLEFPSMIEAARFFGMHKDSMQYRLRKGPEEIYPEGYQYMRKHGNTDWPTGRDRRVLVRNPFTLEEKVFKNLAEVCSTFDISPASASKWITYPTHPVLPGYFQMKYLSDESEWTFHSCPEISLALHNNTTPVLVTNTEGKTVKIYSSKKECAESIGLKPSTLSERFKAGKGSFMIKDLKYSSVCSQSDL